MAWMPFFYDYYYLILVVPALLLSLLAQGALRSTYRKMSSVRSLRGMTGAQAAASVLVYYGINNVRIERVGGTLSDHYDPRTNVIRLSQPVFDGTSIASIGIACHEAGHAAQHSENYVPVKMRNAVLPITNVGSALGLPLAIVGYFMGFGPLITIGLLLFSFIVIFQLVTLPVEFNASARAIRVIGEMSMLNPEEQAGAKKVLRAAAMTYVAALAVSIATLLRFILRFGARR